MASKELTQLNHSALSKVIDDAIIAGCCAGDRDAQHSLYEQCHRQVFGLMSHIVGVQDAADLTQQVFLQVFQNIEKFGGQSNFRTWLYRLATNEALQYLRKGHRWKFQPLVREPVSDQASMIERIDQKDLLDEALSRIDPELRLIFLLREVEVLSYREIAEVTSIPEGTVGSRLNRARRQLQLQLTELGWEP